MVEELARRGKRVLVWDRPNCGASDVCFAGSSESAHHTCHPDPLEIMAEEMATLDNSSCRKVMGENAAKLYRL